MPGPAFLPSSSRFDARIKTRPGDSRRATIATIATRPSKTRISAIQTPCGTLAERRRGMVS